MKESRIKILIKSIIKYSAYVLPILSYQQTCMNIYNIAIKLNWMKERTANKIRRKNSSFQKRLWASQQPKCFKEISFHFCFECKLKATATAEVRNYV